MNKKKIVCIFNNTSQALIISFKSDIDGPKFDNLEVLPYFVVKTETDKKYSEFEIESL